jgi:hypothetical protein
MKTFTERIVELDKEYQCGFFNPPMSDRESMSFLRRYLLGEDWYSVNPLPQEQINTEIVHEILYKYSRRYRKEYKRHIKRKKKNKE